MRKKPKKCNPPKKPKNKDRRSREYLTSGEIDKLSSAAKKMGRHGLRDSAMILMCFRHGFRVSELINLRWNQVDFGVWPVMEQKIGLRSHVEALTTMFPEFTVWPNVAIDIG